MDIRVLEYFLAVAREESISKAAEALHMTQPPLSRQLKELEEELGKQLFIRGSRKITLTEEGLLLRQRAEEIVELLEKTRSEIQTTDTEVTGNIYIGGGETDGMRLLASVIKKVQRDYPLIRYHIFSGNAQDVAERLEKGLVDFGLFLGSPDLDKYDYLQLPLVDTWGVIMPKDCALAQRPSVRPQDLQGLPLLCSRQMLEDNAISGWLGYDAAKLNIFATYNLINTPALFAEEGIGYVLSFDKIINLSGTSSLCFRPLEPKLEAHMYLAWKKYHIFTKAAAIFLKYLHQSLAQEK